MRESIRLGVRRGAASTFFCVLLVISFRDAIAADLEEAEISQIIKEVQLLPVQAAPRPASIKDSVKNGTAVRTGSDSRAELTFTDQTLARVGANTIFSFNKGTRDLNLGSGVMLVHVPKGAGGAKIVTAGVTAGITGTTIMIEYHKGGSIKLISLEGTVRMWLAARLGESVLLNAGQMLIVKPYARSLPDPVEVDLERIMKTSLLITEFPPLPSEHLIAEEIHDQKVKKTKGTLIDTNMVIYGRGTLVSLNDPPPIDTLDQRIAALTTITGGPLLSSSEFGALNTITTPNPYVITSGTAIMTAPTIKTAGVIDQGKIYRGQQADGAAATYFFGSQSAFDSASSFNALGEGGNGSIPMAVFKFNSLQLAGNPAITIPQGGAPNLGLVSIGNMTSGPPGGTLTFAGISNVLLATQSGSINLGSEIDFANFNSLSLYARGAGSNVTMGSSANLNLVSLTAEGSVQVNANETVNAFRVFAGTDFLAGAGHVTAGDINIFAGNNATFRLSDFGVPVGLFPTVTLNVGATLDIITPGDKSVFLNAASIDVTAGNITFTGGSGTTLAFNDAAPVSFSATAGDINASGTTFIKSGGMDFFASGNIIADGFNTAGIISAGGNINTTADLLSRVASAGGSITVGGNLTNSQQTVASGAGSTITVTGTLTSPDVENVGDISANHIVVLNINSNFAAQGATINTILTAGAGGITPFQPGAQHTFNVSTVNSTAAGINFSGSSVNPNGGLLQINDSGSQLFTPASGINGVNFNGTDQAAPGLPAGDGGTFGLTAQGTITLNKSIITATTGMIDPNDPPSGAGGTVTLASEGALTITNGSRIQVSSADPAGQLPPRRASATGGKISLSSSQNTGTAISIDNTSQLLAVLANAPPPGAEGKILIEATAGGKVSVDGSLQANHGLIDVRGNGDVDINTNANMRADFLKIAVLSPTGTLTINGGIMNADATLRLYADGSNGQIIFAGNCTLSAIDLNIIAAKTITINNGVTVNIQGLPVDVYTDKPNYAMSSGGNGTTTGIIGGLGTSKPQPASFASRPPLPGPTGH